MVTRGEEQRHDQEDERADHQVDARAEHVIDFAHVIGGTCHGIADRLEIVEGHALAEQGNVQLIAHITFDALGHELGTEIAAQLQNPAEDLRSAHQQGPSGSSTFVSGGTLSMALKASPVRTGT